MKAIWLDDSANRKANANALEQYFKVKLPKQKVSVFFVDLQKKEVSDEISKLLKNYKKSPPNLVIIDQVLNAAKQEIGIPIHFGSSIVEVLRESWQHIPIIGITGQELDAEKLLPRRIFDELFSISLQNRSLHDEIYAIFRGYQQLRNAEISIAKLLPKFQCMDEDEEIIGNLLKGQFQDKKFPLFDFAHWVRIELMGYPGLLLNSAFAANLIGLNATGFQKIEPLLQKAKYKGPFSSEARPRWWKSAILQYVFENSNNQNESLSWRAGHDLPSIVKSDYSKCVHCQKYYPEVLGFKDKTILKDSLDIFSKCVPFHIRCSKHDERFSSRPYFEDVRVSNEA